MLRLPRTARGAVIALVFGLVYAAPAAAAVPTRTVRHLPADRVGHFPADDGCTFNVTVYSDPKGRVTVTDFSNGTEVYEVHAMFRTISVGRHICSATQSPGRPSWAPPVAVGFGIAPASIGR